MAKNKKVVISNEELTPTVLITLKDKKKSSIFGMVWLVFIFAILIAGVYYLPELSQYVKSYLYPTVDNPGYVTPGDITKPEDEDPLVILEYKISENPVIETDYFKISNIKINGSNISFVIKNITSEELNMDNYNYYFNLYNGRKRLLQRIFLKDIKVASNDEKTLEYDLKDNSVEIVTLTEFSRDDYPKYIIKADEEGKAMLTCTKSNETINYLLSDNKLYSVEDIFKVNADDKDYTELYVNYHRLASSYNEVEGVSSDVNVLDNVMTFTTIYNLNTYVDNSIYNRIVYQKDLDAKVMKFELEASGYTCN